MSEKIFTFGYTEIEKHKFHYSSHPIDKSNTDIDKIIISNRVSVSKKGFKYFIGYQYDDKIKP